MGLVRGIFFSRNFTRSVTAKSLATELLILQASPRGLKLESFLPEWEGEKGMSKNTGDAFL
jgi:hypothetical protein